MLCVIRQAQTADSAVTFLEVDPLDFVGPPRPVRGDTLLTLNDTTASLRRWIDLLERPHMAGREVRATFRHKGIEQANLFHTRPVQTEMRISVLVLQALKILIFISFITMGLWAFARRKDSAAVRALALYLHRHGELHDVHAAAHVSPRWRRSRFRIRGWCAASSC